MYFVLLTGEISCASLDEINQLFKAHTVTRGMFSKWLVILSPSAKSHSFLGFSWSTLQ